jgi:hypothetical protein
MTSKTATALQIAVMIYFIVSGVSRIDHGPMWMRVLNGVLVAGASAVLVWSVVKVRKRESEQR